MNKYHCHSILELRKFMEQLSLAEAGLQAKSENMHTLVTVHLWFSIRGTIKNGQLLKLVDFTDFD
jgi:hypothetical protein